MLKERLILQIAVLLLGCSSTIAGDYELYYQGLPTEVARVVPVDIPANTVSITDFGGVGDGIALNTAAFSKAISTLAKKGGGRLTVPAGIWLTGPIALKDNIDFHLEKNAVVYFSPNKLLYVAEREGKGRVLFYATPDMLSGLCGWAFFDNNETDAVVSQFGSGCSSVVSMTVLENDRQGYRCFIGLFDPSVRPYIGTNELSFTIPFSRFTRMTGTMKECFLFDSHAWKKVKARLEE